GPRAAPPHLLRDQRASADRKGAWARHDQTRGGVCQAGARGDRLSSLARESAPGRSVSLLWGRAEFQGRDPAESRSPLARIRRSLLFRGAAPVILAGHGPLPLPSLRPPVVAS